jgi:hypothetical protein
LIKETTDFEKYWFNGEAELSSSNLHKRYGELREGKAVMIL